MRLINTTTRELREFDDATRPHYAILSHTWGDEEVSFQEWRAYNISQPLASHDSFQLSDPFQLMPEPQWVERLEQKAGFKKIIKFCDLSQTFGYDWAWVDTCCIDKSSSAELSEAINSMFEWYKDSKYCIGYLSDVRDDDYEWVMKSVRDISSVSYRILRSPHLERFKSCGFMSSRWFKRGWTLQELLAPTNVKFFDAEWQPICHRRELAEVIECITNIPANVPTCEPDRDQAENHDWHPCSGYSVAQKMSWASRRVTTRAEDMAYCLLGIFDINMPLLYGEGGAKAFRRLQEEIIKVSTDHSIFAWHTARVGGPPANGDTVGPILADSLIRFVIAADVVNELQSHMGGELYEGSKMSYSITNYGQQIELPLLPCPICHERARSDKCYLAQLNCFVYTDCPRRIGICVRQDRSGQFQRAHCNYISRRRVDDEHPKVYGEKREMFIRTVGRIQHATG